MSPIVSIILPTFNRLKYLPPAVESVLSQTFSDWELIIADDGSDPETRAYLKSLESAHRIRVLWRHHTGNPGAVRNAALGEARGEYIAFLDSDDIWLPDKLELQIGALSLSATRRWSYTGYTCIDAAGNEMACPGGHRWVPYSGAISDQILRHEALICTPSVVAARDLIGRVGGFDEQQTLFEDQDLWLRLLRFSDVEVIDKPLIRVRKHDQNMYCGGIPLLASRYRMYRKQHALLTDHGLRTTVERLGAQDAVALANRYAETGRLLALQTLFGSWPHPLHHAECWNGALRVMLKLVVPRGLLAIYRRIRV